MKKTLFLAALFAAVSLSSCSEELINPSTTTPAEETRQWSNHVSMEQAKKRLVNIVAEMNSQIPAGANRIATVNESSAATMQCTPLNDKMQPLTRAEAETDASCYVMRLDNDMFAIMSATTDKPELLAIGNGYPNFEDSTANLPNPNYWTLPTGGSGTIGGTGTTGTIEPFYVYKRAKPTYSPMYNGGLCKVKWGNGEPYNQMMDSVTDTWGTDTVAAAGCLALAIAQAMTIPNLRGAYYKDEVFDWDDLAGRRDKSSFNNPTARYKIAKLFQDLNNKENLASTPGSPVTWAPFGYIPRTLMNFHISNPGTLTRYDDSVYKVISVVDTVKKSTPKFDLIKSELDAGYPVLFEGSGYHIENGVEIREGGHEWLCHGMAEANTLVEVWRYSSRAAAMEGIEEPVFVMDYNETSWLLQMNWGWDGKADGYYITKFENDLNSKKGPDHEEDGVPSVPGWNNFKNGSLFFRHGIRK